MTTITKLDSIEIKDKAKLFLPEVVVDKIKYLCNKIDTVEWSGTLFYKILKGDIQHPADLEMEAVDIYLQDKGSAAHSAFKMDESILDLYDKNEELEECRQAMLHSHVNMGVFFSGTDMSELEDNCRHYDFYLSLIVNNKFETCAKIAVYAKQNIQLEQKSYLQIRGTDGNPINIDTSKSESKETESMIVINVDVVPIKKLIEDDFFIKRVDEVIKKADEVKYVPTGVYTNNNWNHEYNQGRWYDDDYSWPYAGGFKDNKETKPKYNPKEYMITSDGVTEADATSFLEQLFKVKSGGMLSNRLQALNDKYVDETELFTYVTDIFNPESKNYNRILKITLGSPYTEDEICDLFQKCDDVLHFYSHMSIVKAIRDYLQEYIEEVAIIKLDNNG